MLPRHLNTAEYRALANETVHLSHAETRRKIEDLENSCEAYDDRQAGDPRFVGRTLHDQRVILLTRRIARCMLIYRVHSDKKENDKDFLTAHYGVNPKIQQKKLWNQLRITSRNLTLQVVASLLISFLSSYTDRNASMCQGDAPFVVH